MKPKTKAMLVTGGIALVVAVAVVWASNNVDAVENVIG